MVVVNKSVLDSLDLDHTDVQLLSIIYDKKAAPVGTIFQEIKNNRSSFYTNSLSKRTIYDRLNKMKEANVLVKTTAYSGKWAVPHNLREPVKLLIEARKRFEREYKQHMKETYDEGD